MSESSSARVYTLPILRLTTVSEGAGPGFLPVNHQHAGHAVKYWRKLQAGPEARWRSFPKFPLVLNGAGRPWEAACLYLLDRVLARPRQLASLSSVAQVLPPTEN
jgi:hypothetical protein